MTLSVRILSVVLLAVSIASCSNSDTPVDTSKNNSHSQTAIVIKCHALSPARAGESYVLWFRYTNDSTWHAMVTVKVTYIDIHGNMTNIFYVDSVARMSDLSQAMLSLEHAQGSSPALALLEGTFIAGDTLGAALTAEHLGNFDNLTSNLVFTSTSSDSLAYTKEFYLMNFDGTKYTPSLSALPTPGKGWTYGLWAVDSTYEPDQLIYYGTFTSASGHDSYNVGDNLAYPGGDGRHPMNSATGSIIVTLEPDWYGNEVGKLGPTSFSLLRFDRIPNIIRDSDYMMTNVSATTIPNGTVQVFKL